MELVRFRSTASTHHSVLSAFAHTQPDAFPHLSLSAYAHLLPLKLELPKSGHSAELATVQIS